MIAGEPDRTPYDVKFQLFGIPVRIHPFFWVMAVLLGISGREVNPYQMLIWVGAVFVSIVIHELGHAVVARYYGYRPWITLHGFGGLASYSAAQSQPPKERILVLLAGPGAGFAFALVLVAAIRLGGSEIFFRPSVMPVLFEPFPSPYLNLLLLNLLYVNIFWGLVNLLPVYPLDGGQISREVLVEHRPYEGIRQSLIISMVVAIGIAIAALVYVGFYMALLFGYLAYINYATLQAYSGGQGRW